MYVGLHRVLASILASQYLLVVSKMQFSCWCLIKMNFYVQIEIRFKIFTIYDGTVLVLVFDT